MLPPAGKSPLLLLVQRAQVRDHLASRQTPLLPGRCCQGVGTARDLDQTEGRQGRKPGRAKIRGHLSACLVNGRRWLLFSPRDSVIVFCAVSRPLSCSDGSHTWGGAQPGSTRYTWVCVLFSLSFRMWYGRERTQRKHEAATCVDRNGHETKFME